jgi:molybdopterin molybdotransferase
MGEEDHVKRQVEALGQLQVWKLAIKPGKPLAYGRVLDTPILGLPGNPGAVFVTFCMVVRPYLLRLCGVNEVTPAAIAAIAGFDWPYAGTRQEFLRVAVEPGADGVNRAQLHANQSSGVLSSAAWANGLAVVPIGTAIKTGQPITVLPLSELLH